MPTLPLRGKYDRKQVCLGLLQLMQQHSTTVITVTIPTERSTNTCA